MTPTSAGWKDDEVLLVMTSGKGVTTAALGLVCWGFKRVFGGGMSEEEEEEGLRRVGGAILTLLDQTLEEGLVIRL